MKYVCGHCHAVFDSSPELTAHIDSTHESDGPPPGFGQLGESVEAFEDRRISALKDLSPVPTRPASEISAQDEGRKLALLVKPLMAELRKDVTDLVEDLRRDIQDSNRLMKSLDVPLEAVTDSHERAWSSFERMRAEVNKISERLSGVEKVIDTAGLTEAVGAAERRMAALCARMENLYAKTSQDMVDILKLLKALQSRELAGVTQTSARVKRIIGKVNRAAKQ